MSLPSDALHQFFNLLDHYPRFVSLWNRDEREYDPDAAETTLNVCSPGEAVILKCLLTIWRGNAGATGEFAIDLAALAVVDTHHRHPLLHWLAEPFWP